jgi:hypothetical protein
MPDILIGMFSRKVITDEQNGFLTHLLFRLFSKNAILWNPDQFEYKLYQ